MIANNIKPTINRLRRIQGQVKGLEKMVTDNQYCVDIITQSLAIEKSLKSFNRVMLENHLKEHATHQFRKGEEAKAISELMKIYFLNNK
jgi:DNA-binding FrmR family transcriptional regulator